MHPTAPQHLDLGHGTHVGLRRQHNEDTYYADGELGLWLVADGLGGHALGEVASAVARDTIVQQVRHGRPLSQAIEAANAEIYNLGHGPGHKNKEGDMGTTVVAIRSAKSGFELAWVGDSRAYVWTGQLQQISRDHSYVQDMVNQGLITPEQAIHHPHRHVISQALGTTNGDDLKIDILPFRLNPGQSLLLCSDGLSEMVPFNDIERLLARRDINAQECADHLINLALDAGGVDNVTVVVLHAQ
jgi:serine/threonine protein phosphatase PrpC